MKIFSRKIGGQRIQSTRHKAQPPNSYTTDEIEMSAWSIDGSHFSVYFGMDGRSYVLELTREEASSIGESLTRVLKETEEEYKKTYKE